MGKYGTWSLASARGLKADLLRVRVGVGQIHPREESVGPGTLRLDTLTTAQSQGHLPQDTCR